MVYRTWSMLTGSAHPLASTPAGAPPMIAKKSLPEPIIFVNGTSMLVSSGMRCPHAERWVIEGQHGNSK